MNRLSVRLFFSHVVVVLIGAATTYALVQVLAPRLFDSGMAGMGGMGRGQGQEVHAAFAGAVNAALLMGLGIAVLAAAAAGGVAAYRLLRPLAAVRAAARRLSQGHYDEIVVAPREVELAALAGDVNSLGAALAHTEQRRVRLLSEIAHEMRTPLTVIDGYVEGMIDGVFPAGPEALGQVRSVRRWAGCGGSPMISAHCRAPRRGGWTCGSSSSTWPQSPPRRRSGCARNCRTPGSR